MQFSELLITGYDGEEPVFAINLTAGTASIMITQTTKDGVTVTAPIRHQTSDAYTRIQALLDDILRPTAATSQL